MGLLVAERGTRRQPVDGEVETGAGPTRDGRAFTVSDCAIRALDVIADYVVAVDMHAQEANIGAGGVVSAVGEDAG